MQTPPEPGPLSSAAERLAVLALASGAFVMSLNTSVMGALLPFISPEMMLDEGEGKLLIGMAGLTGIAGSLLLSPLVDRYGRRSTLLWGMGVFALASLLHVVPAGFVGLCLARGLAGFSAGLVYSSASAALADIVPYARRGKAMAIFTAGMFLAIPIGLPLAVLFAGLGDWSGIYLVQGTVALGAWIAIRRHLPAGSMANRSLLLDLPKLMTAEVVAALLSVALYVGAFFTAVQLLGTWLHTQHIVAREGQWIVWAGLGAFSAIGSLLLGPMGDRIGKRRWTNLTSVVVALLLVGLSQVNGAVGLLVVGIPLALVSAARSGPFQALISELVPKEIRGSLMGIRSAAVNAGTGVFPVLVIGAYEAVLLQAAAGVFVSLLLVVFLVKKR